MRTMKRILFAIAMTALCAPAYAEQQCGKAEEIVAALETDFHEIQVGGGIVNNQVVVVIYAAPGGETWTALSMGVDGSACVLASGEQWFGGLPELPVPGERGA